MQRHKLYLSLGSNLGNRKELMTKAIEEIGKRIGAVVRQSSFYVTEPWGFQSDNAFLNACIYVETSLSPYAVLELTQAIERELGRVRKSKAGMYSDRPIDIDILLYDDLKMATPNLIIPHPLMAERDFVMKPLKEILEAMKP